MSIDVDNGLTLDREQFKRLPVSERMAILFDNTEDIKKGVRWHRVHQRIQYVAVATLFILVGILFKIRLGIA